MGACLSCLGLNGDRGNEGERTRLLDAQHDANQGYSAYGQLPHPVPPRNLMSAEEAKREQDALSRITGWASDQVVDIFPHQYKNTIAAAAKVSEEHESEAGASSHHDILLSMIPGDKMKRSIRIYPPSRPGSGASFHSMHEKWSKKSGSTRSRDSNVLVKLDVDVT